MYFGWPQIIYLVLMVLGLGITLAKHGEPDTHNFWTTLIASGLVLWILAAGGFFSNACH